MKVSEKIKRAEKDGRPFWSFEYFPPKTENGLVNLYDRIDRMGRNLKPEFVDITWNAGGESSDLTLEVCKTTQREIGLDTCMHLTCTNMPLQKIDAALREAKDSGIQNILALRGDPPRVAGDSSPILSHHGDSKKFNYASDLVRYIREKYGDYFCIGVAGYPEGHPDEEDKSLDLKYLKMKVDAGADFIVTQFFYDCDLFFKWTKKCRDIGITVPIIPGIMNIQSYTGLKRMANLCKIKIPSFIEDSLKKIRENDEAVKNYGIQLVIKICEQLLKNGILGFHFYTLNLERSTTLILEGLELVSVPGILTRTSSIPTIVPSSILSGTSNAKFWRHHAAAGVTRTNAWDEFVNGRWGDSRSPAYGNIDGYGVNFKFDLGEVDALWGAPATFQDLANLFVGYLEGNIAILPWCQYAIEAETRPIQQRLLSINRKGAYTIDSQPAIDAIPSADETFGWGPKNGFCFQKAYIEFFANRPLVDLLISEIKKRYPYMTYLACSEEGQLECNQEPDYANAVTWGLFPGSEVSQPTVIDPQAFLAWKEEAFQIWQEWIRVYPRSSPSHRFLSSASSSLYLVNIVDNNPKSKYAIFDLIEWCQDKLDS